MIRDNFKFTNVDYPWRECCEIFWTKVDKSFKENIQQCERCEHRFKCWTARGVK